MRHRKKLIVKVLQLSNFLHTLHTWFDQLKCSISVWMWENLTKKKEQRKKKKNMEKDSNLKQFLFGRTRSFTPGRMSLIYESQLIYVWLCICFCFIFCIDFFFRFCLPNWTKAHKKKKSAFGLNEILLWLCESSFRSVIQSKCFC